MKLNAPFELCTPAVRTLGSEFNKPLYFENHSLRHPLGIYNESVSHVRAKLEKVLGVLEVTFKEEFEFSNRNKEWDDSLLTAQKEFIYAMYEHVVDDCKMILLCFFLTKEQRNSNARYKSFINNNKSYRRLLRVSTNHLKHSHGRLRGHFFHSEKFCAPGYFVETMLPDGALGPYPKVHGNEDTAFSFARDLRLHFVHFMFISRDLANAVKAINTPKTSPVPEGNFNWVLDVGQRIAALPKWYYPNEGRLPNPWVKVRGNLNNPSGLLLSYGNSPKPVTLQSCGLEKITIETTYSGDGTTTSFRVPYKNWNG